MNKTIYIRDEDVPTWNRAKELAGDSISQVIVAGLRDFVTRSEREALEAKGFQRIVVSYNDADNLWIPKVKAFLGRWIIPIEDPLIVKSAVVNSERHYAVALTAKGAAVVYRKHIKGDPSGEFTVTEEHFDVYESLDAAAADDDVNWAVRVAMKRRGIEVEELDI